MMHPTESRHGAFATRDFYLACFLRCAGYELLELRAEDPVQGLRASGSADTATPPSIAHRHSAPLSRT
jgi:hypothetical protein